MKVIAVAHRSEDASLEDFAPHLEPEANHVLGMYRDEIVREIYSRADGKGAIVVLECDGEADAGKLLAELPLAKAGLLSFDVYGTKPYRGITQHAKLEQ